MKIQRLIAMTMLLLDREVVSTGELAEKLEVSRRTIFRDIDTLSMAGLPIMMTRGSAGGVSLMKSYKVDKKLFTPDDIRSLVASLTSYQQLLGKREIANTLTKLQSLSEGHGDGFISVDLQLNQGNRSLRNLLKLIESAMGDARLLLFQYTDKKGDSTSRAVEPYQVVFKESHWYLQAYCTARQDYRIFKLARMSDVRLSEATFAPRDFTTLPMDGSDWMTDARAPVLIRIDKAMKDQVIERFGEDNIVETREHDCIAKYPIADNEDGYRTLLKFGAACEIIEPASVRRNFARYLRRMLAMYEGSNRNRL